MHQDASNRVFIITLKYSLDTLSHPFKKWNQVKAHNNIQK